MKDSFLLVVNPKAGAGEAGRQLPDLISELERLGARFTVQLTEYSNHAEHLVRGALRDGIDGVAVVGGDGTFSEAVNGFFDEDGELIETNAWLGPLPCGTGGDFRKTVRIDSGIGSKVTRLMWAKPRPVDVGWMSFQGHDEKPRHRAFLNIASFGIGGLVDQIVNDSPKWMGGSISFFAGTLRAMMQYEPKRVRIKIDGGTPMDLSVLNVAIANGRFFGGGMKIAPHAEIDDGLFDVVGLSGQHVAELLRFSAVIYAGQHLQSEGVSHCQGARIEAEPLGNDPVLLDIDGEALGKLPAVFEIRERAIRLKA